jgi:hypothetical protein
VADADVAAQLLHVPLHEHVADESVFLARTECAVPVGHDPGGILAAMLQDHQRVIQPLIDRLMTDDADDATH